MISRFITLFVFVGVLTAVFTLRADAYEGKKASGQFHIVYDHSDASDFIREAIRVILQKGKVVDAR